MKAWPFALLMVLTLGAAPSWQSIEQLRAAAESGQHAAEYQLGIAYRDGDRVAKNQEKAVEWFQRAADGCYAAAQDALGVAYQTGSGVPPSARAAARWFRLAAAQKDPRGSYHLALALYENQAFESDAVDDVRFAGSCKTLSLNHGAVPGDELHSNDPRIRAENGFRFMRFAAESGDADAQFRLGDALEHGKGVPPNPADAVQWYRKAAAQGQPDAKASLARLHARA